MRRYFLSHSDLIIWPNPYATSVLDLVSVSLNQCTEPMEVCWEFHVLRVSMWTCKSVPVPCAASVNVDTDDDTAGLHFGGDWDYSGYTNLSAAAAADYATETVQSALYDLMDQITMIGGVYCVYMAAMIFLGAPYVLTSYKLLNKIQFMVGGLSKPWFIFIVLVMLYSLKLANLLYMQIVNELNLFQIIGFALQDPCFMESEFMSTLFNETAQVCSEIEHSHHLFTSSQKNLDYDKSVEDTYNGFYWDAVGMSPYPESERLFADGRDVLNHTDLIWENGTECSMETMLDDIGPSGSIDFWGLIVLTGSLSSMLIQPALANLVRCIFVMIDPLSPYNGRIVIPFQDTTEESAPPEHPQKTDCADEQMLAEIRRFERTKNVCPLLFWFGATIFICVVMTFPTTSQ